MTQRVEEVSVNKKARAVFTILPGLYRNVDAPPRLRLDVENTKMRRIFVLADEYLRTYGDCNQ